MARNDDESVASLPAFEPSHPGRIFDRMVLRGLNMPLAHVAKHLGVSRQTLYELINGNRAMTADLAARIARASGNSPLFWLNLQAQWDAWHASRDESLKGIKKLEPAA